MGSQINFSQIFQTAAMLAATAATGGAAALTFASLASNVAQQAMQNLGLPKALESAMMSAMQAGMGNYAGAMDGAADLMKALQNSASPADYGNLERALQDFQQAVEQYFRQVLKELSEGGDEEGGKKSGSRGGAPDFFIAMARALGQALQEQANKVEQLSNELSDAVNAAQGTEGDDRADAQNAIMEVQTELMGESMRLNYMAQGIHTALAKTGEALSTMGRAQ